MGILEDIYAELKLISAKLDVPDQPPVEPPLPPPSAGEVTVNLMLHAAVDVPANGSIINARFTTAGEYYLWVYGVFPSVSADSFFVALNNEPDTIFDAAENRQGPNPQWSVLNKRGAAGVDQTPRKLVFVAGENVVKIKPREPGATIQRLFLTHGTQLPVGATLPTVPPPVVVPPVVPPVVAPTEGDIWASPMATGSGSGSKDSPWTIAQALGVNLPAGRRVWLRGGTYNLSNLPGKGVVCKLAGTAGKRVTVASAPGEWVTLRGLLYCRAQYVDFCDFEIVGLDTNRRSSIAQAYTPSDLLGGGLDCQSDNSDSIIVGKNRFIGLIIHDCNNNGVGFWRTQPGNELHDCVIYYNGWLGADRPHGHGIYTQNLPGQGEFSINNSCIFRNFVYGVQAYGQGDFVNNYRVDGCAFWGSGEPSRNHAGGLQQSVVLGAGFPAKGIKFNNSVSYGFASAHLGYQGNASVKHMDLEMIRNRLYGGVELTNWTTITGGMNRASNVAYTNSGSAKIPGLEIATPIATEIYVRTSAFAKRAHVYIFNPLGLATVPVPVSVLQLGESYRVRDAQNFFGAPVAEGVYDGEISIPMINLTAAQPIGAGLTPIEHSGPKFGAFVVEAKP